MKTTPHDEAIERLPVFAASLSEQIAEIEVY